MAACAAVSWSRVARAAARAASASSPRFGEVVAGRRVKDGARRVDDDRRIRTPAAAHRLLRIAALRAHARDQQRQRRRERAHARDLVRRGGADDEAQAPVAVPRTGGQPRDLFVQRAAAGQRQRLQVGRAWVGGAAQQEQAATVVAQVWFDRIEAHVRRQRHRVGLVAHEDLARVLLGGGANVAALGVEDHRHVRRDAAHVRHQPLQLVLGTVRGEVRDLRLEGAHQVLRRIDDACAEVEQALRVATPGQWQLRRLGVEADTQQRLAAPLRRGQTIEKVHAPDCPATRAAVDAVSRPPRGAAPGFPPDRCSSPASSLSGVRARPPAPRPACR
jgi:hypothetical protein